MSENVEPTIPEHDADEVPTPGQFGVETEEHIQQIAPFAKLAAEATDAAEKRGEELVGNLTSSCKALTAALTNLDEEEDAVAKSYRLRRDHLTTQLRGVQAALAVVRPSENAGGPTSADVMPLPTQGPWTRG